MARAVGWLRRPQGVWLRKALFQVHLWTGLGVGLYIVVISVTGSVLVYRSELRQRFNPEPRPVEISGPRLSEDALLEATGGVYPDHAVEVWTIPDDPTGPQVNGVGAVLLVLLSMTGAIIWWPGIQGWRRSLLIDWGANWRREVTPRLGAGCRRSGAAHGRARAPARGARGDPAAGRRGAT